MRKIIGTFLCILVCSSVVLAQQPVYTLDFDKHALQFTSAIHYGLAVAWPESKAMQNAGFTDSYRKLHINPLLDRGFTRTPRAATTSTLYGVRDRIDFIYYRSAHLNTIESRVIDYHPMIFPSDHAGVMTVFEYGKL